MLPTAISEPHIRSSTDVAVRLFAETRAGALLEIRISRTAIEQAFRLVTSTRRSRQVVVEAEMNRIWRVAAARYEATPDDTRPIMIEAGDLSQTSRLDAADASVRGEDDPRNERPHAWPSVA